MSITDGIEKMSIVMQTHLEIESDLKITAKRFRQFTLAAACTFPISFSDIFFYAM